MKQSTRWFRDLNASMVLLSSRFDCLLGFLYLFLQSTRDHATEKKKWLQRTHDEPAGLFLCIALYALCLALFSLVFPPFLSSDRYEKSRELKILGTDFSTVISLSKKSSTFDVSEEILSTLILCYDTARKGPVAPHDVLWMTMKPLFTLALIP